MEASFCGSDNLSTGGFHYNTNHLQEMGHHFGKTLFEYFAPDIEAAKSLETSLSSVSTAVDQNNGSASVGTPIAGQRLSSEGDTLMESKRMDSRSTKGDMTSVNKMSIKALSEKLKEELQSGNPEFAPAERYIFIA